MKLDCGHFSFDMAIPYSFTARKFILYKIRERLKSKSGN